MADSATLAVAVIVLHWRGLDDTVACLTSLGQQAGVQLRVILVNNDEANADAGLLHAQFPSAVHLNTGRNLGYSGGNNVGLEHALAAGYEHILVLNNDTLLEADCLLNLCRETSGQPSVAAAAPKSYFFAQRNVIYFAGGRISPEGYTEHIGVGLADSPQFDQATDCDWLTGCAILFRAEALRRIGLFEPRYFVCFEDSDWSLRARRAGYRLRYAAQARLWHKVSPNFGQTWSPSYTYYYTRNNLWWIERNFPARRWLALYRHALARIRYITATAQAAMSPAMAAGVTPAIRAGVRDYVLRRFGQRQAGRS